MRITVRMYEVGFGDCFLVGFETVAGKRWLLVDCGTITESKAQLTAIVDDILAQTRGADGISRLVLVVGTHRHKDHVWGFADPRWSDVEVGEVWMPWTEDPGDPEATRIRERQSALALALAGEPSDDNPLADPVRAAPSATRLQGARAMALNALSNESAMATLHSGFAGNAPRRFLPEHGQTRQARSVPGLDGAVFHVLGPPRGKEALALMDPPEGAGYLRWPNRIPKRRKGPPFAERYCIREPKYVPLAAGSTFRPRDRAATRKAIAEPAGLLGAALDRAVNNTSLVFMIEAGARFLLFTGDAQWGNWQAMLDQPACAALLERTTMLKVGHHGSHNATPRALIDGLASKPITVLFSTKRVPQWPNIPREPLLQALRKRRDQMARTDDLANVQPPFTHVPGLCVEWIC